MVKKLKAFPLISVTDRDDCYATSIQHSTRSQKGRALRQEKEIKGIQIGK